MRSSNLIASDLTCRVAKRYLEAVFVPLKYFRDKKDELRQIFSKNTKGLEPWEIANVIKKEIIPFFTDHRLKKVY